MPMGDENVNCIYTWMEKYLIAIYILKFSSYVSSKQKTILFVCWERKEVYLCTVDPADGIFFKTTMFFSNDENLKAKNTLSYNQIFNDD